MRSALVLIFIVASSLASATTYYIDPMGSDNNNGSSSHPWKSLSYACINARQPGDTIYVNEGTYLETQRCDLAVGVSIVGTGDSSHIISHYTTTGLSNGLIKLESLKEGTDGSQSISYLKLDGDLTGTIAIYVVCRSNVKIHHCTITDFDQSGIGFRGGYPSYKPSIYAKGNEIYSCNITNSSTRGDVSDGLIRISGQEGMLIYDNILIQTDKPSGENGNIIDAVAGYNKGLKYFRNKSYKPESEGSGWNLHIESWNSTGGIEVYENVFHGGGCHIDVAGTANIRGTYEYSWWIHDNLFMMDTQKERVPDEPYVTGISFEATNEYAIVSNNHFKNLPYGVFNVIGQSDRYQNQISIYNNLFENMGHANSYWAFAIYLSATENLAIPPKMTNFNIYNNTITSGNPGRLTGGIHIRQVGTVSDVFIKNNIITNCLYPYYVNGGAGSVKNIYTQNNLLFNNEEDSMYHPDYISNYVSTNNLKLNPLFNAINDFNLQSGSPAIDSGTDVGIPYRGMAPDIGYIESGTGTIVVSNPVYVRSFINDATPQKLEMIFSLSLTNIVPSVSTFEVKVNGSPRNVTNVYISGAKVVLTLSSPVEYGDVITITYTKPASKPIQTFHGGQALSVSLQAVTNNRAAPAITQTPPQPQLPTNQPPVVKISSPIKGSSYTSPATVVIDVEAFDHDGSIHSVALYNGNKILGERTVAPYSFSLKDLNEGEYSLHATATDNLNLTTKSALLEFEVKAEVYMNENFSLYPNPNHGRFSVDLPMLTEGDRYTVMICDIVGNTVYREEVPDGVLTQHVDLSNLKEGIYILMISAGRILHTQKFIKV